MHVGKIMKGIAWALMLALMGLDSGCARRDASSNQLEALESAYSPCRRNSVESWFGGDAEENYQKVGGHPLYGPDDIVYRGNCCGYRGNDPGHRTVRAFSLLGVVGPLASAFGNPTFFTNDLPPA